MGILDKLKGGNPSERLTRESIDITDQVAVITTTAGVIHAYFYPEIAPNHVRNFLYLSRRGFYEGSPFHRIVDQFVIQTGEARSNWREKVPPLPAEFSELLHQQGTLAAARTSDPNSATSQFYFVLERTYAHHLDRQYTVFGQAFRGLDTIAAIAANWLMKTQGMPERQAERTPGDDAIQKIEIVGAGPFAEEIAETKAQLGVS